LDESKLRQAIMNFVDNAIFYSRPGSVIKVDLIKTAKDLALTVQDTGIGVPMSERLHLFTKFYRASNARTARPDGTGIGLFMAKKVVVAHGGSIIFNSVEGKGSTFGFRLPLKQPAETLEDHPKELKQ
jgi:signal transduction histidine kinase